MADGESDYQVGSGCCAGRAPLSPLLWKSTQGRGWGLASRAQHHQGGTPKLFAMFKHWSGPPDEQCYDLFLALFLGLRFISWAVWLRYRIPERRKGCHYRQC